MCTGRSSFVRVMPGPDTRASGARSRSTLALHHRNARKALRGYGPYAAQGAKGGKHQGGRPSGYAAQGAQGGKQQGGRSSGYASQPRQQGGEQQEQPSSSGRASGYTAQHQQQPWWRSGSWGTWGVWWGPMRAATELARAASRPAPAAPTARQTI